MSIVSHAVAVLRMPVNKVRCQIILPTTVAISSAEKARNDSVRTLPSAPRLKLSDMAEDSSGASDVIPSLRPEDVLHGHSKCLRQLLEGICPLRGILSVADSLIGKVRKHDISYHDHPP